MSEPGPPTSFASLGHFRISNCPGETPEKASGVAWSYHSPAFKLELYEGNWTRAESEESIVALTGEAYWNGERVSAERLEQLLKNGATIPPNLDGSFLLIIANLVSGSCMVCVDRLASKKAFYRQVGAGWTVSSSLQLAATTQAALNVGALAAYLLNGIPLGGQTLLQGIRILPGGSTALLKAGGLTVQRYWTYDIDESFAGKSEKKLVSEFGELLFDGIAMRLRGDSLPRILSLSGGYDSTCIMASALRVLGPKDIRAFSYVSAQGRADNADAMIAADVSRHWKIDHRVIQIPEPPLRELVEGNARRAFAAANPCGELGIWTNLDQRLDFVPGQARLFFGDNIFGHDQNWRLSSREDALAWLPVPGLEEFAQLSPFLNEATFEATKNAYADVLGEVLERGAKIENPINLKDFFYFEQRAQHALMPWRERFCGQHGQAVNPLMDGAVLEYYRHVPREYRRRRKLYRKTVEAMYPQFFERKRATTLGSALSFRSMLNADAAWVDERIRTLHPALAEVVSGPLIHALLPSLSGPAKAPEKSGWKPIARRWLKNTALGEATRGYVPRSRQIERETILIRLLIADGALRLLLR